MNNGAFGENFPYSNFHDLNMDWIIKIAKDFLDQYSNIQNTITDGLTDLQEKYDTLEGLLNEWYDTHSEDIENQLQDALSDLANALANTINSFQTEAEEIAEQVIASIPSDYTALSNKVTALENGSIRAGNTIINNDNYTTYIPSGDLNNFVENPQIYCCNGLTLATNQPVSTMTGLLIVYRYSTSRAIGVMQFYYGNNGITAYRINHGSSDNPEWYDWTVNNPATLLKSSGNVINNANLQTRVENGDLNNLYQDQRIYYCSGLTDASNQPVTTMSGMLFILRYSPTYPAGVMQFYFDTHSGSIHYRISHGSSESWYWDEWYAITANDYVKSGRVIIRNTNYETYMENGDLDNFIDTSSIYYMAGLTLALNQPIPQMDGMFIIYKYNPDVQIGCMQIFYSNKGDIYYRISHGSTLSWDKWNLVTTRFNKLTCKIFKKVVCCGDSYTSGYIVDTGNNIDRVNEQFSWPHYMETLTGNKWINCGVSGANALTWQTDDRGLYKAKSVGKASAYILALMLNDASTDPDRHLDVGTPADIGVTNTTYYSQYSKIIRELATINPDAPIFLCTIPNASDQYTDYITAVKTIYTTYADTYNVHLLDLYAYMNLYNMTSLILDKRSGHYTSAGYEQFAEILSFILSEYINTNVRKFIDNAFTPYDPVLTHEAINQIIDANNPTSFVATVNTSYVDAKGKYCTINGKTYVSIVVRMLRDVTSGLNSNFPELPTPAYEHQLIPEYNSADDISDNYTIYTTGWRMNGARKTGDIFFIYGSYDS